MSNNLFDIKFRPDQTFNSNLNSKNYQEGLYFPGESGFPIRKILNIIKDENNEFCVEVELIDQPGYQIIKMDYFRYLFTNILCDFLM